MASGQAYTHQRATGTRLDVDVAGASVGELVAWADGRAGALEAVGDDFEVRGGAHGVVAACDGLRGGRVEGRVRVDERLRGRDV